MGNFLVVGYCLWEWQAENHRMEFPPNKIRVNLDSGVKLGVRSFCFTIIQVNILSGEISEKHVPKDNDLHLNMYHNKIWVP